MGLYVNETEVKFRVSSFAPFCKILKEKCGKFCGKVFERKKQIERIAKMLGLKFEERIIKTYRELWEEFCKEKGIKDENITFASVKKIEK